MKWIMRIIRRLFKRDAPAASLPETWEQEIMPGESAIPRDVWEREDAGAAIGRPQEVWDGDGTGSGAMRTSHPTTNQQRDVWEQEYTMPASSRAWLDEGITEEAVTGIFHGERVHVSDSVRAGQDLPRVDIFEISDKVEAMSRRYPRTLDVSRG